MNNLPFHSQSMSRFETIGKSLRRLARVLSVVGITHLLGYGVRLGASGGGDYTRSYQYTHACADADSYIHTHTHTNGNADSYVHTNTHADFNTYTYAYTNGNTDSYARADIHACADPNTYTHAYTDGNANSYAHADIHACADPNTYTHAYTATGWLGHHPPHPNPLAGLVPRMVARWPQDCVHL